MKTFNLILLVVLIVSLISCSGTKSDKIVKQIEKECNIYTKQETAGIHKFYSYSLSDKEVYTLDKKVKGVIDKTLKVLPKVENLDKYSSFNEEIYNYYEWETPKIFVKMESTFGKYPKIKLWMIDK